VRGGCRGWSPGDHVSADDLITAEVAQEVRIEQGDLLVSRAGHRAATGSPVNPIAIF
jgi:hypothetical protein